jgi:predicted thioredoxin/glutaredoxin
MARRVDQVEVVDLPSRALYLSAAVCALMVIPRSFSMSIESSTCSSISRSLQAATALDQAVGQRGFAVINVRNDRKISDVIHQRERLSD